MAKKNKKEKQSPNFIVFLVEGESDQIALETPLADLIWEKNPDYEVRFLLQQRVVNSSGNEMDDISEEEDDEDEDVEYVDDIEYSYGGDITTSSFVTPNNIEIKITNRFIKPAIKKEGLYPKRIAKIIHVVDLDGAYIPDNCIIHPTPDHYDIEKPFYDGTNGVIETWDINGIIDRNARKRKNLDYLLSLSNTGIKIGTKKIPYEIYFFASNLDHFINHDANLGSNKKYYADIFVREYGLDQKKFCDFFFNDPSSIGILGYEESWFEIKKDTNSIKRHSNLDCLIRRLLEMD